MKKITFFLINILILIIPYRKLLYLNEFWNLQKIIGLIIACIFFIAILTGNQKIIPRFFLIFYFLISFQIISVFGNIIIGNEINLKELLLRIQLFVLMFIVAHLTTSENKINNLMKIILCASIFANIYSIYHFIFHGEYGSLTGHLSEVREPGAYGNPVENAYYLTMISSILLYSLNENIIRKNKKMTILLGVILLTYIFVIITTYSRAGYVLFLFSFIVISYYFLKRKKSLKIILPTLAVLIFILILAGSTDLVKTHTKRGDLLVPVIGFNKNDPSAINRLELQKGAFKAFIKYPIFGLGIGNFYEKGPLFTNREPQSTENAFLKILVEDGIIFLSVLFISFFILLKPLWSHKLKFNKYSYIFKTGFYVIILFNLLIPLGVSDPMTYIWLGIMIGITNKSIAFKSQIQNQ